MTLTLS